ncbi:Rrf2 family transcriptional regulator [Exiguobacterium sp. A1_3_1]|uniref:RrF2 family transcriptional regulator n=1 Tax=Exiguobacterium sp. A1_3_1 TaxID=2651871 RepID=UPI003B87AFA7
MKLTQFTQHAIQILLYLGVYQQDFKKIEDLATHYNVSTNHLRKVMQYLSKLEYIETRRGPLGGIRLIRSVNQITIGQLVRELEPLDLAGNFDTPLPSLFQINREGETIFDQALDAFLYQLDQVTLEDLIRLDQKPIHFLIFPPDD